MRQSFHVRLGVAEDAGCLAVLATQVWLHTYATDGISPEIAAYVLSHLTPAQYAQLLRDASTQVLVALHAHHVVGLAVVRFDTPCPDHPDLVFRYTRRRAHVGYPSEMGMGHHGSKPRP